MEITLEKIELVKDRTGSTYAEAKAALEAADGSVVDAIIALEETMNKEHDKVDGGSLKDSPLFAKLKETLAFFRRKGENGGGLWLWKSDSGQGISGGQIFRCRFPERSAQEGPDICHNGQTAVRDQLLEITGKRFFGQISHFYFANSVREVMI